jgi:hypothetical protein
LKSPGRGTGLLLGLVLGVSRAPGASGQADSTVASQATSAGGGSTCVTVGSVPEWAHGPRPRSTVGFAPGERLSFSVQYGLITAGDASLEVDSLLRQREGRVTYHLVSQATSNSMFSTFFKVHDRVESFMDTLELHSVRFEKHLREGNFKQDRMTRFDQERHKAMDGQRECDVAEHVQDILSSLYYVRTVPLEVGKSVYVPNHDNGKNYPLEVKVHARERVVVDAGTFDCLVIEPILLGEAVFKQNGRVKVWVTDDDLHMPVLLKSKVFVGAIAGVLTRFELGGRFHDGRPPAMVSAP